MNSHCEKMKTDFHTYLEKKELIGVFTRNQYKFIRTSFFYGNEDSKFQNRIHPPLRSKLHLVIQKSGPAKPVNGNPPKSFCRS